MAEWKLGGDVKDESITLPFPFTHRPKIGARWLVRQYTRRYITCLYREISDWIESSRQRASNLLLISIIYTEEFMINFLDNLLVSLYKAVLTKEDKVLNKKIPMIIRYLGRYC